MNITTQQYNVIGHTQVHIIIKEDKRYKYLQLSNCMYLISTSRDFYHVNYCKAYCTLVLKCAFKNIITYCTLILVQLALIGIGCFSVHGALR